MLNDLGACDTVERIARGETTAEAVVRACLDRIAAREEHVQAWAYFDPAQALRAAAASDRSAPGAPLRGLAIGIKDNFDTADMPTGYGSPIYAGHRPAGDAACVAILRAAGAIILGKTASTEFAAVNPAPTRNPHNLAHAPGGSSSGSAAAVADRMVAVALGTQTGGSVIRPASFCGVVGFKPSFGLINRAGIKPAAESIDTVGVFARNVEDTGLVAAVLMGADPAAFAVRLSRAPRIAVYRGPEWGKAEPSAITAFDDSLRRLTEAGAKTTEIAPPAILAEANAVQSAVARFEFARALAYEWQAHRAAISAVMQDAVTEGLAVALADYLAGQKTVEEARRWIAGSFAEFDFWLTLSATGEAPAGRTTIGDSAFNRLWSILHLPAITLPAGRGPKGLPLGIQLIGPRHGDAGLIAAARWCKDCLDAASA